MGRPDPEFNRSSRPGVLEMAEVTTKHANDAVQKVSVVVCGEEAISVNSRRCHKLKGAEYVYVGVMVAAVLAIVLSVSLVFALRKDDEIQYNPRATPAPTRPPSLTPPPSPTPPPKATRPPTPAPTWAPTTAALAFLPAYAQESLRDDKSPQSKALAWLSSVGLVHMEDWKRKQLFGLATFYYQMGGPNWQFPENSWLDETRSECNWYSSTNEDNAPAFHFSTCNEKGEFQVLRLDGSQEPGLVWSREPHLPNELALLDISLKSIDFNNNNFYGMFKDFLGPQIFQMESLQDLSLANNSFYGRLPSSLGLFSSLQRLQLQHNRITFPMPSEMGGMTSLQYLLLQDNSISGEIPSQLGALTHLESLVLHDNAYTGFIPSELGLLTNLKVLDLANNFISGEIPQEVLALPNLVVFNTTNNRLSPS